MENDTNLNDGLVVSFEQVSKRYDAEEALAEVSFSVAKGSFVCLIGPSGCGKSTVLKMIAGIETPSSGSVRAPERVGMVFQSGALFPWYTARENVSLGLEAWGFSPKHARAQAEEYLDLMNLGDHAEKYPRELSGGQRQRVGLARALVRKPEALLLDEPFSALDPKITEELHRDILALWKKTGTTVIMVSHLIEEAVALADRVLLMKEHRIVREFPIALPRPRRDSEQLFAHEVQTIRREFFR